jgi:hypothetical protein
MGVIGGTFEVVLDAAHVKVLRQKQAGFTNIHL